MFKPAFSDQCEGEDLIHELNVDNPGHRVWKYHLPVRIICENCRFIVPSTKHSKVKIGNVIITMFLAIAINRVIQEP